MNYLSQLRAFDEWLDLNSLNSSAISLWYALMALANKSGWKDTFTVAVSVLEHKSGLGRAAVYRARNTLKQVGLLDFKDRGANRPAEYAMKVLYQNDTHFETQSDTQSETQSDTQSDTHSETINKQNKKKPNPTKRDTPNPLMRFPEFWSEYPKKAAKQDAEKAWAKLRPDDALTDRIIADVKLRRSGTDWTRDGGRYIPNPATYLNGHRWEDEEAQPADAWTELGRKIGVF